MRERSMSMLEENPSKLDVLGHVARGNWWDVTDIYKRYPEKRKVQIARTGDTALHVAVSDEKEYWVQKMVAVAGSDELAMGNGQGNTPLHLAAIIGNASICRCIAEKDGRLIGARNVYGETPIFSAVARGRTQAFLYLHNFCKDKAGCQEYVYYRRNNGDTILHSAISERHFDIAYIIIKEYPKLVHRVNEEGLSPLHLLATKLSVFPSGVGIRKLVYPFIRVRKLEQLSDPAKAPNPDSERDTARVHMCRETCAYWVTSTCYKCCDLIHLLVIGCCRRIRQVEVTTNEQIDHWEHPEDEEAPNVGQDRKEIDQQDEEATKKQVDNQENLQEDDEKSSSEQGFKQGRGVMAVLNAICFGCLICAFHLLYLSFYVFLFILYVSFHVLLFICYGCIIMLPKKIARAALKSAKYVIGYEKYISLKHVKERSIWSMEVMDKLLKCNSEYPYEQRGMRPELPTEEHEYLAQIFPGTAIEMVETPILIAAKNGVVEMVLGILDVHPDAIFDVNAENKNIAMLAVEYRQPHLYEVLLGDWRIKQTIFGQVDINGNSLLHIAANHGAGEQQEFWHIRGAALQLHMEVKWYKFVKHSMPPRFFARYNNFRQTPKEIVRESHRSLIEEGRQWLTSTSQSCSVVAALIATVAFATSATVPGGLKQDKGTPTLEHRPVFIISAATSLIALSSSMISVVMFLAILTSSFKLKDFRRDLPNKLLLGLISLLVSIVSMLVSFYAGHHFVLKDEFVHAAIAVYTLLCFPLVFFIITKFPLDLKIVWTTLSTKPRK